MEGGGENAKHRKYVRKGKKISYFKELISPRGREARIQQVKLWQEKKKKELKRTKNYLVGGWKRIQPLIEQVGGHNLS